MTRLIILICALVLIFGIGMSCAVTDDVVLIAKGGGGGGQGTSGKGSSSQGSSGSDADSSSRGRGEGGNELRDQQHRDGEVEIRGPEAEGEVEHGVETEHNRSQGK
jgi:hypothetical protein